MTPFPPTIGVRLTTGHLSWAATLTPAGMIPLVDLGVTWLAVALAVVLLGAATVTVRGRRVTGWAAAVTTWWRRRDVAPAKPSEPAAGTIVRPGDRVAVRWHGEHLVCLIELVPRPFTPTVVVRGEALTDDVLSTRMVERLLSAFAPDLAADVVSAGYRLGRTAPPNLIALYDQVVGPDPAPAHRRTWILLRAEPQATRRSAARREPGIAGLALYLIASATRLADRLASDGIDARPAGSFDDFDDATEIDFQREMWSLIEGRNTFTTAYAAPGGPTVWWSARADHTITRVQVRCNRPPKTTVLLTTLTPPVAPQGFSCLVGGQRAALGGDGAAADLHHELPIGSAGILVGETVDRCPVYLPFDDVDVGLEVGDARVFAQFVIRSAAAGAVVTLPPQFVGLAGFINARIGTEPMVHWPRATTYLGRHDGASQVSWCRDAIATPRHQRLPIRLISPREESRYQMAMGPRTDEQ